MSGFFSHLEYAQRSERKSLDLGLCVLLQYVAQNLGFLSRKEWLLEKFVKDLIHSHKWNINILTQNSQLGNIIKNNRNPSKLIVQDNTVALLSKSPWFASKKAPFRWMLQKPKGL